MQTLTDTSVSASLVMPILNVGVTDLTITTSIDSLRTVANTAHDNAQAAGRSVLKYAHQAGEALLQIKEEGKRTGSIPHGRFAAWVADNCSFSYQTAAKYMLVARRASKSIIDYSFEGGMVAFLDACADKRADDEDDDAPAPTPAIAPTVQAAIPAPTTPAAPPKPAPAPAPASATPAPAAVTPPWEDEASSTANSPEQPAPATVTPEPDAVEDDTVVGTRRNRLRAEDVMTDPDMKAKQELLHLQIAIAGGSDFTGTIVDHFMTTYMKEFTAGGVFNTMKATMVKALHDGHDVDDARQMAADNMEAFKQQMLDYVETVCDKGVELFSTRTAPMLSDNPVVEKSIKLAFHSGTETHVALSAATKALELMRK